MSVLREKMIKELKLKMMSEKTIKNYLYHLQVNRKLSPNSLNVIHCAIRFFYTNVLNAEWVVKDIARFKRDKSKPLVLNKTEVEAILNLTWNLKHKTILTLIYSAGLRVSEAAKLKVNQIDTERMQIYIKDGKGGADRYALLSTTTLKLIKEYIEEYRPVDYQSLSIR